MKTFILRLIVQMAFIALLAAACGRDAPISTPYEQPLSLVIVPF